MASANSKIPLVTRSKADMQTKPQDNKKTRTKRNPCGACGENVDTSVSSITCDACKKWHHLGCTELAEEDITFYKGRASKFKWFCRLCDPKVTEVLTYFEKFQKMTNELIKVEKKIDNKLADFQKKIEKLEKTNTSAKVEKKIEEKIENIEAEKVEKELIEAKKNNLVYFGIPETVAEEPAEKLEYDRGVFIEINGEKEEEFDDEQITDMFRIGKKSENAPRPLIVKFKDFETRSEYLKNGVNLKNDDGSKIFVNLDLTPTQRAERKNLVKQMNHRRENGEPNLVIRNNKIVDKENFRKDNPPKRVNWRNHILKKDK